MSKMYHRIRKNRYEILLFTLMLHLFNAVFFKGLEVYQNYVWPFDMMLLGFGCYGLFSESKPYLKLIKNILFVAVIIVTIIYAFTHIRIPDVLVVQTIVYATFFIFIFIEVLRFLMSPGYINTDIVIAAVCGYLLLIEASLFSMQFAFYIIPNAFQGININGSTTIFLDFVYYATTTITSVGFGDIVPTHHVSKLLTSITAIAGQLYSVVLVGVIISKYTSAQTRELEDDQ